MTIVRPVDHSFRVRTTSDELTVAVSQLWAPCVITPGNENEDDDAATPLVEAAPGPTQPWREVLLALVSELNRRVIEASRSFAVHAGVVAGPAGAVAFPADSGSGKSTLTAACLCAGMTYISDEALVLDDTGAVLPYLKPMSLSAWSASVTGLGDRGIDVGLERLVAPGDVGSLATGKSRLAHVVVMDRRSDGPATLHPMSRADAVPLLMRNSFNHYRRPEIHLRLVAAAAAQALTWRLECSDPNDAAAAVKSLVNGT